MTWLKFLQQFHHRVMLQIEASDCSDQTVPLWVCTVLALAYLLKQLKAIIKGYTIFSGQFFSIFSSHEPSSS